MKIRSGGTMAVTGADRFFPDIRNGNAFMRGANAIAVAANFTHIQLFNPVGSAITIIVKAAKFGSVTAGTTQLGQHNTALTTLNGVGQNLNNGGDVGIGEVRSQANATQLFTPVMSLTSLANFAVDMPESWLQELGAGEGMIFTRDVVNVAIFTAFWWIEL